MSFRLRLTLFGTGVVALTVFAFGWLVYQLATRTQAADQDRVLMNRVTEAGAAIQNAPAGELVGRADVNLAAAEDLHTRTDVFVEVLDATGRPLASSARIGDAAPAIPADLLTGTSVQSSPLTTLDQVGIRLRLAVRHWARADLGTEGYVVAGQPTSIQASNLTGLRVFLIVAAIPALLAALAASWVITGRALKPLRSVAETAQAIGRTRNLDQRLPQREGRDELSQLSQSFNQMLAQLQQAQQQLAAALETQRRFVADASHELRTPLTTIRGNAGLLAFGPTVTDEVRLAAARDIAAETERMSRLVERLLTLAQADAGQKLQLAPVALRPIVESVCRQSQTAHPDKTIRILDPDPLPAVFSQGTHEPSAIRVAGDEDALTQLLWILVDNAVKFTQQGGRIDIGLAAVGRTARLTVADDGFGIPPADLERIFDRFYQADAARASTGAGLGLSIARWIVAQHAGTITARNNEGRGSTFTVELPLISED